MYHLNMNKIRVEPQCDALHLIETLVRTGKVMETRLDEALAPLGLTTTQWGMLRALAQAGAPLPLGEVAARIACVKSNATQLADRLEAQGLIARVANPVDRRSTRAALTQAGHATYAAGAQIVRAFEDQHLNWLDAQGRETLDAFFASIV